MANTMQAADSEATFTLQTQPTLLQQRCFELWGVTPRMWPEPTPQKPDNFNNNSDLHAIQRWNFRLVLCPENCA